MQSYVAGGTAINELLSTQRLSRDVDIFHDTLSALETAWKVDSSSLQKAGYRVSVIRALTGFIEAEVSLDGDSVLLQWARDSAFRFFPLIPHVDFGLVLHPFDLATNKVLALVGRLEVRDWIDTLACHQKVAPLGLLVWAACGKDEGWNPQLILDEANRNARLSREEWVDIEWDGTPPNLATHKMAWREAIRDARQIIEMLPPEHAGKAVLLSSGEVFKGSVTELRMALENKQLDFHCGHIGGVWPQIKN